MTRLLIVFILVLFNGFFAMSEMAVMTSRRTRLRQMAQNSRRAAKALDLAEHPERFTPSAGKITALNLPGGTGIRVDTAAYAEGVIPPYYDSLIAKLVARGRDRDEAISRMSRALDMFVVEGIFTSIPLHKRIMADADFRAGNIDTKFMERFLAQNNNKDAMKQ